MSFNASSRKTYSNGFEVQAQSAWSRSASGGSAGCSSGENFVDKIPAAGLELVSVEARR